MIAAAALDHSALVSLEFKPIYDANVDFVWRVLRRLGVPTADTADAAQEVFMVVYRRLPEFEGRSKLSTWLYEICLRVASDRRRAAARRSRDAQSLSTLTDAPVESGTEEQVKRRQGQALLERILDSLSEEQRAAFVLCDMEELDGEQAAKILGVPEGTLRSRLRLAREAFRAAVARFQAREAFSTRGAP